ncbi:hypothetical protein LTR27_007350 [Elasticomyces elasticus]|nr:hypothetical protein LTR27_007350 [Elasticomyces elasticus]
MLRGSSVFIDGGVQLFRDNETTWMGSSKYIFEFDMSDSWNASTNFTEKKIGRYGDTSMNSNPPNMVRGALYRGPGNDTRLFTFGGSTFLANQSDPDWQAPVSDQIGLWSYDTSSMTWAQYDVTDVAPRRPNWGSVTEAIAQGIGFFLNGQIDRGSSEVMYTLSEYVGGELSNATNNQTTYLGGMVMIDMPTQTARNVSTETLGAPRVGGGLVHSPRFGKTKGGTLVAFGGMQSTNDRNNTFNNGALIDFGNVALCDNFMEENVTWFNQSTLGDIPPPRIDFCVLPGLKSAKDNSSHNIYIHGGYDPTTSVMYDDVYLLSLPSFTWTMLWSGTTGRFGHSCNTAGKRQMLRTGGSLDASMYAVETSGQLPNLTAMQCDPKEGVALFDLTALTWSSFYNAYAADYQLPNKVVDLIGGSPDGGATMSEPIIGFNRGVSTMFDPPAATTTAITPTSSSPVTEPHHKSNVGAIVGGVVGGVAVLCIALGLAIWAMRRRSRKARTEPSLETPPAYSKSEHPDLKIKDPQAHGEGWNSKAQMEEILKDKTGSPFSELSPDAAVHEMAAEYPFSVHEMSAGRPSFRRPSIQSPGARDPTFEIFPDAIETQHTDSTRREDDNELPRP